MDHQVCEALIAQVFPSSRNLQCCQAPWPVRGVAKRCKAAGEHQCFGSLVFFYFKGLWSIRRHGYIVCCLSFSLMLTTLMLMKMCHYNCNYRCFLCIEKSHWTILDRQRFPLLRLPHANPLPVFGRSFPWSLLNVSPSVCLTIPHHPQLPAKSTLEVDLLQTST